jgi:hypothetical protein
MKNVLFIVCIILVITGCNQTKNHWVKAKQTNSIVEIKKFLDENPASEFDAEAKNLLDSLVWVQTLQSNAIVDYKSFVENYPNSKNKESALIILDSLEWENALSQNTEESFKAFIASYPKSKHYEDAKTRVRSELSGVVYIKMEFKNGSGFFADAVDVIYFIDMENCKRYVLDIQRGNNFDVSSDIRPCKIAGYIKKNIIVCTSISTNLEKFEGQEIMDNYTNKCMVKK